MLKNVGAHEVTEADRVAGTELLGKLDSNSDAELTLQEIDQNASDTNIKGDDLKNLKEAVRTNASIDQFLTTSQSEKRFTGLI